MDTQTEEIPELDVMFSEIARQLSVMPDDKVRTTLLLLNVSSIPGEVEVGKGRCRHAVHTGALADDMIKLMRRIPHTRKRQAHKSVVRLTPDKRHLLAMVIKNVSAELGAELPAKL